MSIVYRNVRFMLKTKTSNVSLFCTKNFKHIETVWSQWKWLLVTNTFEIQTWTFFPCLIQLQMYRSISFLKTYVQIEIWSNPLWIRSVCPRKFGPETGVRLILTNWVLLNEFCRLKNGMVASYLTVDTFLDVLVEKRFPLIYYTLVNIHSEVGVCNRKLPWGRNGNEVDL